MDRMEILRKVAAGEISADEAARLLQQPEAQAEAQPEEKAKRTESSAQPEGETRSTDIRWLHVRIHDLETDRDQVKVNVPIGLLWPMSWFGPRGGWGWHGSWRWMRHWSWWEEVEEALERGETGTLVDVEDDEHRKHITVYVD